MLGFRKFELKLARRYLKSKAEGEGSNAITKLSLAGITLAVFSLVATLSVRDGYKHEFLATILGSSPHVVLTAAGDAGIQKYDVVASGVNGLEDVAFAYPVNLNTAIASYGSMEGGVEVHGMVPGDFAQLPMMQDDALKLSAGSKDLGAGVSVGSGIADRLGLKIGDKIDLLSSASISSDAELPAPPKGEFSYKPKMTAQSVTEDVQKSGPNTKFKVSHIFKIGREEVDNTRIYMSLGASRELFDAGAGADAIHIILKDPNQTLPTKKKLESAFPGLEATTWKEASATLLAAMHLEDKAMFIILSILVVIASLNIVSGLVMLVKTKSSDIGIMRTIGLSRAAIMRVFFLAGAYIGVLGTVIGILIGVIFALYIQDVMDFLSVFIGEDPEMAGVDAITLTARISATNIAISAIGSLLITFLITLIPALKASRMNPIEALKDD